MNAQFQGTKTHLWAGAALFFAMVVAARDVRSSYNQVKGNSWSAAWSWPGDLGHVDRETGLSDEQLVDLLYSSPNTSPDHPSLRERMSFQREYGDYGLQESFDNAGFVPQIDYRPNHSYSDYDSPALDGEDYVGDDRAAFQDGPSSSSYMRTSTSLNNKKPHVTSYSHRIIHKTK